MKKLFIIFALATATVMSHAQSAGDYYLSVGGTNGIVPANSTNLLITYGGYSAQQRVDEYTNAGAQAAFQTVIPYSGGTVQLVKFMSIGNGQTFTWESTPSESFSIPLTSTNPQSVFFDMNLQCGNYFEIYVANTNSVALTNFMVTYLLKYPKYGAVTSVTH